jgi:single-strand DNA-binding protein
MNVCVFMGRLGSAPEIRYSRDGKAVCKFSFAVNRAYKGDDNIDCDWLPCVCFGKVAERIEKLALQRGTKLAIKAEARNNNYTDRDGLKHYEFSFIVSEFEFCESKPVGAVPASAPARTQSARPQAARPAQPEPVQEEFMVPDNIEEELPFN